VTGLAVAAGPVVGGAVAQGIAWPWIFWLNVPIGLVLIPPILLKLAPGTRAATRLDPLGLVLAAGGALGLVVGLIRANSVGWSSPGIVAALIAGAVLTGAFIGWELRLCVGAIASDTPAPADIGPPPPRPTPARAVRCRCGGAR
jgi:hypothetical protein